MWILLFPKQWAEHIVFLHSILSSLLNYTEITGCSCHLVHPIIQLLQLSSYKKLKLWNLLWSITSEAVENHLTCGGLQTATKYSETTGLIWFDLMFQSRSIRQSVSMVWFHQSLIEMKGFFEACQSAVQYFKNEEYGMSRLNYSARQL